MFSWQSTFILLLALLVIILIVRNLLQDERLNKLEKKLEELTKAAESVNQRPASPNQSTPSFSEQPASTEALKTVVQPKEPAKVETEYEFAKAETVPDATQKKSFYLLSIIKSWILTGNPIAKIGILILFIGVAFLLKYAAQHVTLSIEFRLMGAFLAGMIMVGIGWRLGVPAAKCENSFPDSTLLISKTLVHPQKGKKRGASHTSRFAFPSLQPPSRKISERIADWRKSRNDFANILQGGGVGIMYLTVYAAFAIYNLLPFTVALLLLTAIVILTGVISVLRNAKAIALTGILGGFLAPILISTGPYHHLVLFTYYLILNVAILGISWFKSWRDLNLVGFIFTFIISALWGWQSYQSDYLFSTEVFLITFFLFYVALSILFTIHQEAGLKKIIDSVITFGTPIAVLTLQFSLMKNIHHGLAWSTFSFMLFYAILALILFTMSASTFRGLSAAFTAIAVMFGTITIPLAFTGLWISSIWALESVVMLWFGVRHNQFFPRLAAGIILIASTILFIINSQTEYIDQPFFNVYYLSGLVIVFANLICSYLFYTLHDQLGEGEYSFAVLFFIVGCLGWYYFNFERIYTYVIYHDQFIVFLTFLASTSLIAWIVHEALNWYWLRIPAIALLPAMAIMSLPVHPFGYYHPYGSLPSWLFAFVVFYSILYRHEKFPNDYLSGLHLCAFLFLTWFLADRLDVILRQYPDVPFTWSFIAWAIFPVLMLYLMSYYRKRLTWPLVKYEASYWQAGGSVLVIFILPWFLVSNLLSGNVSPLIYIPIFNPLDIAIGLALFAVIIWIQSANEWLYHTVESVSYKQILEIASVIFFIWLTAILLRTLHHWLFIPYEWDSLWASMLVQTSLSIFWTVLALIETYIAARANQRILWFLGFGLICIVIIKLFLVDLSGTNTIERIVTFIGVGLILLVNGYISPLPPKEK